MKNIMFLAIMLTSCESRITEIVPPKDLWWLILFGGVFLGIVVHIIIEEIRRTVDVFKKKRRDEGDNSRR